MVANDAHYVQLRALRRRTHGAEGRCEIGRRRAERAKAGWAKAGWARLVRWPRLERPSAKSKTKSRIKGSRNGGPTRYDLG